MARITFKRSPESEQIAKNLATVLFSFFANFFNWFVVAICLIILISGYWFLIRPKYEFIISDQEITSKEREYEEKVAYLKQLTEVKNLYKSISQEDKDKVDFVLSAHQDLDTLKIVLLREIGHLGRLYNVAINDVVITPLDNSAEKMVTIAEPAASNSLSAGLQLIEVSFLVDQTDYGTLKRLLGKVESSLQIMDVNQLDFNPATRQARVTLLTYYLAH